MTEIEEPDERAEPATLSFEAAVEELESIVERLEDGAIGLEEMLRDRRRGEALLERCRAILSTAEREIERLDAAARARGDVGGEAAAPGEDA